MLAWLGGSKRRRWHSNQSKKKSSNRNSRSGSHRPVSDGAAGGTSFRGNETAVELSHMERWASLRALNTTKTSNGHNHVSASAPQILSLDMFALAGPGRTAALSGFQPPQPSRETPPGHSSRDLGAAAATWPTKRRKAEAPGSAAGEQRAAFCGEASRQISDAARSNSADGASDYDAAELSDAGAKGSSSSDDSDCDDVKGAAELSRGRGTGIGAVMSGGGFARRFEGDPDGVRAATVSGVAPAARAGNSAAQTRRCATASHPPSEAGQQLAATNRAAAALTRRGALPAGSLDLIWLASNAT